jgi:hypothetical protein
VEVGGEQAESASVAAATEPQPVTEGSALAVRFAPRRARPEITRGREEVVLSTARTSTIRTCPLVDPAKSTAPLSHWPEVGRRSRRGPERDPSEGRCHHRQVMRPTKASTIHTAM